VNASSNSVFAAAKAETDPSNFALKWKFVKKQFDSKTRFGDFKNVLPKNIFALTTILRCTIEKQHIAF
jgi:hypothetical protein